MNYYIGVTIFSLNLIVTSIGFILAVLIVTYIIRKLLWRNVTNEIELAKTVYLQLEEEVNNKAWFRLKELADKDLQIKNMLHERGLYEEFTRLSKELVACKLLINEFHNVQVNTMDLKSANSTLTFINGLMEDGEEDISRFYQTCVDMAQINKFEEVKVEKPKENTKVYKTSYAMNISQPKQIKSDKDKLIKESETCIKKIERQQPVVFSNTETIISAKTSIQGNVKIDEDITVFGTIVGNVKAGKNLFLFSNSYVTGDVEAMSVEVQQGKVFGKVNAKEQIHIGKNTYIKGDIEANQVTVDGLVHGNIISKHLIVSKDAEILGDIKTTSLEIEKGSKIRGSFTMDA